MHRIVGVPLFTLALLAGCSQPAEEPAPGSYGSTSADVPEGGAAREVMGPPAISVSAAPGVAFSYRYAFVLPDASISAVQEEHAAACEKLSVARCRITGMRYTLVDEDEVRAALEFKLDPALARQFGKEGITAVTRADGKLVDAAIEGTDVGTQIAQSQQRSSGNIDEITRIERQLAAPGLGDAERTALRGQIERLRAQQAQERQSRADGQEMLANTPMTFSYSGNEGFALGDNSIGEAWDTSKTSFAAMVSFILLAIGTLLPWAAVAGLIVFAWRKVRRRKDEKETPVTE